ncbi:hypothetical protein CDAR_206311 [Caerostris darwini]|uniref:Uncharacterized protein n=1 Tax=Caerostris darwini TaxID=1538125 RepID=A0AAV4RM98_9ARAC|nr:hypothetical protein CDAR_206311 [Caerostris darwini]
MTDNTRSRSYHLKYSLLRLPGILYSIKEYSVASVKFKFARLLMEMSWTPCSSDGIIGFQCFSSFRDLIRNFKFRSTLGRKSRRMDFGEDFESGKRWTEGSNK